MFAEIVPFWGAAMRFVFGATFFLIPLITVVLATTLAGEQITPGFLGGAVLVLAGVWFGALMPERGPTTK